ncbi:PREDICTED: interleukin-5 receptor subunit alpha-like [Tinamus guttatus]|uniref:interleukin-5 receptor subunit alpha-like n=1 Tax=Tinamus guttatus TaxID=94827 RepID=UPI00052E7EDD|nr:PREDICTED: interleukin-5 receptor subunit alpha-like [Tinamus guttatus]
MRYRILCSFSEKLNPPVNVSIFLENRSIKIHWNPPPTIGSARNRCFMYQVKITDRKPVNVSEEKYEYPFHKPPYKCAAQVRAKKEKCITNKIWSEWSEPVFIDDEKTVDITLLTLTLICLLVFLGCLLTCACRRYRCLEALTVPVPQAADSIKTWLDAEETHHQYFYRWKEQGEGKMAGNSRVHFIVSQPLRTHPYAHEPAGYMNKVQSFLPVTHNRYMVAEGLSFARKEENKLSVCSQGLPGKEDARGLEISKRYQNTQ